MLCVRCWTADDGQTDCLKYAEFHSKNKFEKLMHLVCFVTRIFYGMFGLHAEGWEVGEGGENTRFRQVHKKQTPAVATQNTAQGE